MVYGAIDLHARYSEIRIIDAEGRVVRERRVRTDPAALVHAFADVGEVRIVLESGTESEWVAQALEAAGHAGVVADPNFAPMYGELHRCVKTNRRDVVALAEANRRGWYRPAHRTSSEQRARRQTVCARRQLVQMRTGTISVIRALLRQAGCRVPACSSHRLTARLERLEVSERLRATLAPLLRTLATLCEEIRGMDEMVTAIAATDPIVRRLQTVPGVGPVVAVTYRAYLDDVHRFTSAGQVSAAIGLVPSEHSSAEYRHRGHITKHGPTEVRSLLVQAAWACWRTKHLGALRVWADRLAARRGKRIAVVALARRLSRILYAIWRDETVFQDRCVVA